MRSWIRIVLISIFLVLIQPQPVFAGDVYGTISNITVDKTSVAANSAVTISFDVSLTETPTASYSYFAYIYATIDENGDSWTPEQWSSPATLVSGNQIRGHWSATVQIAAGAYTGSYIASVGMPTKLFTSSGGARLDISGSPLPTQLSGSIGGISVSTTSLTAGSSYDFYFDVQLNVLPTTPVLFVGSISAKPDENSGDPWTPESWSNKATLISGNAQKGLYKVTISIPSSAYTGDYIFYANCGSTKLITGSNVNVRINGVPPVPAVPPAPLKYVFSNQTLTPSTLSAGQSVRATFHLLSDDQMVQTPECAIDGVASFIYATLTNGGRMDGDWQCSISIPINTVQGRYDFHIVVVGYGNKMKNEERVILPINVASQVVATPSPTPTPAQSNVAYLTTTDVNSSSALTSDSVGGPLAFQASGAPAGRIYIPAGTGTLVVSLNGAGLVSQSSSISGAGMTLVINRNPNAPLNLYLFANGLRGVASVSLNFSGQVISKSVSFGTLGDVGSSPTPTPTPTPTPSPTATPVPQPSPTSSPTPTVRPTPSPTQILTPSPTPSPSRSQTPTPEPEPTKSAIAVKSPSPSPTLSISKSPSPVPSTTPIRNSSPSPSPSKSEAPIAVKPPTPSKSATPTPTPTPTKSASKLITITCVSGKITKHMTGVSPICPKGYKKK